MTRLHILGWQPHGKAAMLGVKTIEFFLKDCCDVSCKPMIEYHKFSLVPVGSKTTHSQFHISHNTPCLPPKTLHNLCFQFPLGITVAPREIKDNAYAKLWGANKVYYGRYANDKLLPLCKPQASHFFRLKISNVSESCLMGVCPFE